MRPRLLKRHPLEGAQRRVTEAIGTPKVRIFHVVESLDQQATERWLLMMMERARAVFQDTEWTFFCIHGERGMLDGRAAALGATVIHSRYALSDKKRFLQHLRQALRMSAPDVLHSHHDIVSGLYLLAAVGLGIRRRIVHVHNTSVDAPVRGAIKRAVFNRVLRAICLRQATDIVGVSSPALEAMLGRHAKTSGRDTILHCGIDTNAFADRFDRAAFRASMGAREATKMLLFVGRLNEYKNPLFALRVIAKLANRDPAVLGVFAGVGPFDKVLRAEAERIGIGDQVVVLGWRNDVPNLMKAADLLLWPSIEEPMEGLGLGVVEAQAAALPVLMSKAIPEEAIVVPSLVEVVPLSGGIEQWSQAAEKLLSQPRIDERQCLRAVEVSTFGLQMGARNLRKLYDERSPSVEHDA